MLIWKSFLLGFSALLPLINPLGSALVFLGLIGEGLPAEVYRVVARKVAINNVIFLAVIELLGSAILNFFGISLPVVQVAGGIVITSIGWSMLNQSDAHKSAQSKEQEAASCMDGNLGDIGQKTFYPFTFPITSGPGTLVVTVTLSAREMNPSLKVNSLGHLGLFLAILLLSALVYVSYAYAPRITKIVRPSTVHGIVRVMSFILVCIGVQIAWNGVSILLATVLHR